MPKLQTKADFWQVFRGRRYHVLLTRSMPKDTRGDADPPDSENKTIRILRELPDDELLEVFLHEALHACLHDLDEDAVSETATSLRDFLVRLGYHLPAGRDCKTCRTSSECMFTAVVD